MLFYHQQAFVESAKSIEATRQALQQVGAELVAIEVPTAAVSVADAVSSYLFNSQLLLKPNGKMALLVPQECQENAAVDAYLKSLIAPTCAIDELLSFNLRQSMRNGGGPACLRLRVALTDQQAQAMHQGVVMTDALYTQLVAWVNKHYRDRLSPEDLADPTLAIEVQTALMELAQILQLPHLYEF